jgi:hypothetical protein
MKRIFVSLFAAVALAGFCVAQNAQSQASGSMSQETSVSSSPSGADASGNGSTAVSQVAHASHKHAQVAEGSQLHSGSTVQAELVKPVDARKNKVGDEVIAKTTQDVKSEGRVVVPKGSKLVGHVTEVKAHSKEQATSTLGIAFDHTILRNGTEMPLALSIQAIGRSQASVAAMEADTMASGAGSMGSSTAPASGGGGVLGGVRSTAGGVVNTAGSTAGGVVSSAGAAGGAVSGSLSANSQGVVGLPGLSLSSQTTSSANASVISSQGSNVHLDGGTEMILRVNQ